LLQNNNETKARLQTLKIIHIAMLVAVAIYGIILYGVVPDLDIQIFPSDDPTLIIIEVTLSIISIIVIALGFFTLKWISGQIKHSWFFGHLTVHIVRIALFVSVGIFGLILGILGAGWQISLSFMIVSFAALLLTFPTEAKIQNTLDKLK
jgi:hypothetical protein